ncbi:MAG: MFS transporter [Bacteroidota bacterium]
MNTPVPSVQPVPLPDRAGLIIATLWLLVFSAASQIIIVAPILPMVGAQLGVGDAVLGTLMTVYAAAVGVSTLLTGPVSDRVGRRRVLLVGAASMAVVLALHGLAESFTSLLVLRALAGAAGGILSGGAVAYVGDTFPPDRRGWANGWVMSGFAVGQILGIPIGRTLADLYGFRAPFLVFAATMVVATVLVWTLLPDATNNRDTERLTLRRVGRGYAELLRRADTRRASVIFAVLFLGVGLFVTYFPVWMENRLGFTGVMISGVYALGGLSNVLIGPRAGRISDIVGRKPVIIAASAGVGLFMAATPLSGGVSWGPFALFFGIMGCAAARYSAFQAMLTELVVGARRGSFMSLTIAIGQVGFAVGSAVAGTLYAGIGFPMSAIIAGGLSVTAALLVWVGLPETLGHDADSEEAIQRTHSQVVHPAGCGPCPESVTTSEKVAVQ